MKMFNPDFRNYNVKGISIGFYLRLKILGVQMKMGEEFVECKFKEVIFLKSDLKIVLRITMMSRIN